MKTALLSTAAVFAVASMLGSAPGANAKSSDHREFEGTVVHVSRENIKVHGVEGGKGQTLSFLIDHGTKIDKMVHGGEIVRIIYDQRLLGVRHADSVDPYGSAAMKMKS